MTEKRRYLSAREKAIVLKRQGNRCACGCGEAFQDVREIHYDHAMPLHLGGTNDLENFRALKVRHHIDKSTKEAKARAKVKRIQDQDGLRKKKMSQKEKALARMTGINPNLLMTR